MFSVHASKYFFRDSDVGQIPEVIDQRSGISKFSAANRKKPQAAADVCDASTHGDAICDKLDMKRYPRDIAALMPNLRAGIFASNSIKHPFKGVF
jgi:hypothetical protein